MAKRLSALIAAMLLPICAIPSKRSDAELAQLMEWFPGRYTNVAQVQDDVRAGREPHAAVEVNIVRVYAPRISEYTFFVQESAADDPRRIFVQRVVSFKAVKDRGIVQSLATFTEPARWRDAHLNTDLFKGMTSEDLAPMGGCELFWKKTKTGFEAANDRSACRVSSAAAGGVVRLSLRAELNVDELALAEQPYTASGKAVQETAGDPFYRFLRQ